MSNWSHVAAICRVDGLEDIDFTKVFGKELHWDSPISEWNDFDEHKDNYLPVGSEGSLKMTVWKNPKDNYLDRYTVSIFGDLRDWENIDMIIEWFAKKINDTGIMVRNACITVDNGMECKTWTYEYEDDEV